MPSDRTQHRASPWICGDVVNDAGGGVTLDDCMMQCFQSVAALSLDALRMPQRRRAWAVQFDDADDVAVRGAGGCPDAMPPVVGLWWLVVHFGSMITLVMPVCFRNSS